jgi:hypothetical protein
MSTFFLDLDEIVNLYEVNQKAAIYGQGRAAPFAVSFQRHWKKPRRNLQD